MEYARQQFAGDLIHIRDHQQETLRGGERRGQCASLQRTVNGSGCTTFRLHFLNVYGVAEEVFAALCRPFVNVFCHWRRWRNGVDGSNLRKHVRDVRCGLVTVTSNKFLVCHKLFRMCHTGCLHARSWSVAHTSAFLPTLSAGAHTAC